jgi:hypothetical protein
VDGLEAAFGVGRATALEISLGVRRWPSFPFGVRGTLSFPSGIGGPSASATIGRDNALYVYAASATIGGDNTLYVYAAFAVRGCDSVTFAAGRNYARYPTIGGRDAGCSVARLERVEREIGISLYGCWSSQRDGEERNAEQ